MVCGNLFNQKKGGQTMTHLFIPYEQALALKELGFNKPCFGRYWIKDFQLRSPKNYNADNEKIDSVSAPLYQQAFRWFREKYNLEYSLKASYDLLDSHIMYLNGKEVCRFIRKNKKWELMNRESEAWKKNPDYYEKTYTYEEAELECLKKLIELTKKKETK